jgi:hypothetical protein
MTHYLRTPFMDAILFTSRRASNKMAAFSETTPSERP